MRSSISFFERLRADLARSVRRFRDDSRGATAIEFAMVAAPFFVLVMGIMTIGTQFLTLHFVEHGVAEASRQLRTGEAQKAGIKLQDFRQLFCDAAGTFVACDNHLVLHIKSSSTFAGLSPPPACMTNGSLTPSAGLATDGIRTRSGDANTAVLVVACYDWEAGASLWQTVWNLLSPTPPTQGKIVLSSVTAFRTEPFE